MSMRIFSLTLALLLGAACLHAQTPSAAKAEVVFLGNEVCPFSGRPVKADKFVSHGSENIYVCCGMCLSKAKADPAAAHAKAYPAAKTVDVKNTKCPLMGKPAKEKHVVTWQGRRIRVCCPMCKRGFRKDPVKFVTLASHEGLKAAKNPMCPVGKRPVKRGHYVIHGKKLWGTCCGDCAEKLAKDPAKYLKKPKAEPGLGGSKG